MAPKALSAVISRLVKAAPGAEGEELACRHLHGLGYRLLARNFRCRSGEIDVIAQDGGTLVFVEVKERHGASHGEGHEGVTWGKRRRIVRAARVYASSRSLGDEQSVRFDVVSIDWREGRPAVRHDRGAFDSEGK